MHFIGTVAELWRYPVKSMRGERLHTAVFDHHGMAGDRRFAVVSSAAPCGKPLLTSRERTAMLLYAPHLDPTPTVLTPGGDRLPLPSPELIAALQRNLATPGATLSLEHSPGRPLTDVRPVSLISRATLDRLSAERHEPVDPQRLRSNLILSLNSCEPFAESTLTGSSLRLGTGPDAPILRILELIPRCRIVSLDPSTAEPDKTLLPHLAKHHMGRIGIYATVLKPGPVNEGAPVLLLNPGEPAL